MARRKDFLAELHQSLLLREAEQYHGEYEPTAPKHHWSGWYAAYIVARQDGKTPEEAALDGKLHIEGAH